MPAKKQAPAQTKRTQRIQPRITPAEREQIERAAAARRMPPAVFVRNVVLDAAEAVLAEG